jgi:CTP synthase
MPHMLVCRTEKKLPQELKNKLSNSCDVDKDAVIEAGDSKSIYKVPLNFLKDGILKPIAKHFELKEIEPDVSEWKNLVKKILKPKHKIKIAFIGKYLGLKEAYKSLTEALIHCGAHLDTKVEINWCDSEEIEKDGAKQIINDSNCILVAGGFGQRGIDGKIEAIKFARQNNIPYLGICLGMQLAVIEFLQNVVGIKGANSVEFDKKTKEPAIYLIEQFLDNTGIKQLRTHKSPMGGTMRLGEYPFECKAKSNLEKAYGWGILKERHRHRYEVNPRYKQRLEDNGMEITGYSDELIEAIEIPNHKWFVGVQFHPEFTSSLQTPNPIILSFLKSSLEFSLKSKER